MLEFSDSTRKIVLIIIKSSIKYGISKKYRKSFNEIKIKLKKPKNKVVYFTKKEQDILNNYLNNNLNLRNLDNNEKSKTKLIVDTPKTDYSIRTIPLPKFLIPILENYKTNNEFYIFTNSLKPKDPRTYEKYFANILKKCEIRNLNFHALRHTFATRAREAGIDIKVLSEILGHSSYHITQEIYVHVSTDFKKNSMDELVNYLTNEKFVELM